MEFRWWAITWVKPNLTQPSDDTTQHNSNYLCYNIQVIFFYIWSLSHFNRLGRSPGIISFDFLISSYFIGGFAWYQVYSV